VIKVFRVNREAVRQRLRDWAQSLAKDADVLSVVLFGSFARGDATAMSDADLLVVLRDSPLRFEDRIPHYRPERVGVCVDVFPYTLAEAQQSLREGWGVVRVALAEGETLYAASGAARMEL
jgi:predicted nucleotidyltransferase